MVRLLAFVGFGVLTGLIVAGIIWLIDRIWPQPKGGSDAS